VVEGGGVMNEKVPGSVSGARHAIGAAKGATPSPPGSLCACCGESPYAETRRTSEVCGPNFTDYDLLADASLPMVCGGCAAMLGGKPGREDRPLRMAHFAVIDGRLEFPDGAVLAAILADPPAELTAIAWTASRQRHASLRCGLCVPGVLYVGTEADTVEWIPGRDAPLLAAVSALRAHARREHVTSGDYPPHVIAALGAAWAPNEAVVARHRPTTRLDMACSIVRRPEVIQESATMPIAEPQRKAADLLLLIAQTSRDREADPIRFWGELLPRRLARACAQRDLLAAVSRLMSDAHCNATYPHAVQAVAWVERMTAEEASEVLTIWRQQAPVVMALTKIIRDENYADRVSGAELVALIPSKGGADDE